MEKFYGTLTTENIEEVANAILDKLTGKTYTFVSSNEYIGAYKPEVKTNQRLQNGNNGSPLSVWHSKDGRRAGFNVCDTYGVWGLSTSQTENRYDSRFNAPYINMERNTIEMTHRAGSGALLYWVIEIQD